MVSKVDRIVENTHALQDLITKKLRELLKEVGAELDDWDISTYGTVSDFWLIIWASKDGKPKRFEFGFSQPDIEEWEWAKSEFGVTDEELDKDEDLSSSIWWYLVLDRVADWLGDVEAMGPEEVFRFE